MSSGFTAHEAAVIVVVAVAMYEPSLMPVLQRARLTTTEPELVGSASRYHGLRRIPVGLTPFTNSPALPQGGAGSILPKE